MTEKENPTFFFVEYGKQSKNVKVRVDVYYAINFTG